MNYHDILTGAYGGTCLKTTDSKVGKFFGFTVWADAVLAEMKVTDKVTGTEVTVTLADEGLASTTIPVGALVVCPYGSGFYISSVKLSSGTIYLLKS